MGKVSKKKRFFYTFFKPKSLLRINLPSCVAWSQDIQRKKHLWNTDYRATWVFWVMGTSHKDSGWRNILTISANSGVFTISETCSQMLKVSSWCTLNLPSLPNSTPSQLSLLLKPGGLGRYGRHGTGSEESGCVPIMFFTHHSIFHQLFGIFLFSQRKINTTQLEQTNIYTGE